MDLKENVRDLIPAKYASKLKQLKRLQKEVKQLEESFRDILLQEMLNNSLGNIEIDGVQYSYVTNYIRKDFDKSRFALEHPAVYKKYIVEKNVSASIRISLL